MSNAADNLKMSYPDWAKGASIPGECLTLRTNSCVDYILSYCTTSAYVHKV
jgi:hypothetical protein